MQLIDVLLLSLGTVLAIIGIYELLAVGLIHAYSFLMPAMVAFLWFLYRKRNRA